MALDGASVLVLVNVGDELNPEWVPVAEQTGLTREVSRNMIDVSHKNEPHTRWLYGKQDGTVTLESLYVPGDAAMQAIRKALHDGVTVILRRSENGVDVEEAEALVQTISDEWPDNDASTVAVDFQLSEPFHPVATGGNGNGNGNGGDGNGGGGG